MEHEIAVQPFFTRWQSRLAEVGFVIAFIAYVTLSVVWAFAHREVFFSAEERATYLFARSFHETSSLAIPAPSTRALPAQVHPPGMIRSGDHLIPQGIPAYPLALGIVSKLMGDWFMPILTPILSIFGVLSLVGLLRPFFGRRIAMTSGALTLIHPAFLTYTLRGYFADGIFLSLAMIAIGLFVRILMLSKHTIPTEGHVELQIPWYLELGKKRHLLSTMFGLAMGLAMVMRPSETVWLGLILTVLFVVMSARLRPFSFLFAASGALIVLIPAVYMHWLYYGAGTQTAIFGLLSNLFVAPFGASPVFLRAVFEYFFIRMSWWMTIPAILGLVQLARKQVINKLRIRLAVISTLALLVAVWVLWYYGGTLGLSGVGDTPSVGSPFARHFLPVYIMTMPLVAAYLSSFQRRTTLNRLWVAAAAVLFIVLGMRSVFWQPQGLLPLTDGYNASTQVRDAVLAATPADAVILTLTPDRMIFPSREVMLLSDTAAEDLVAMRGLRESRAPVWFLGDPDAKGVPNELRIAWRKAGFIPRIRPTFSGVTLYQLQPI